MMLNKLFFALCAGICITFFSGYALAEEPQDGCHTEKYTVCMERSKGITSNMVDCLEAERKNIQAQIESLYQNIVIKQNNQRNDDLKKATQAWKKYREDMSGFLYDADGGSAAKINSLSWMLEETNRFCILLKGQTDLLQ